MINKVVLVGRLTKDPELRKTQSGTSVLSFTCAVNRRFKQEGQPDADFINCVAWSKTADFMGQYATKGALVGVEGRIQTRNYDDATGKKVYVTEVVAENVQLLESKNKSENRATTSGDFRDNSYFQDEPKTFDDFETGPSLDISSDDLPF